MSVQLDVTKHRIHYRRTKGKYHPIGVQARPEDAPVTIVEFSDFECPYCKRFEDTLKQLSPAEMKDVRIIFHHFPLSMHPWARAAAEGAACAQLQSAEAFWAVHDQIFAHQSEITIDNVKKKVTEYAQSVKSLDAKAFQSCLGSEMSLGLVFRDMNLASTNQITGTPTIFINGRASGGSAGYRAIAPTDRTDQDSESDN